MPSLAAFDADQPLGSAPIEPDWITAGNPQARNRVLSTASDGSAWTMLWDCSAGSFRWHYKFDETIHFLEGNALITCRDGLTRRFGAGDMLFCPAGSVAHWHVEDHVKKLAFCHVPAPRLLRLPLKALRYLNKAAGKGLRQLKSQLSDSGLSAREQDADGARASATRRT
jgi:uncharacterized cupin superfamily protein